MGCSHSLLAGIGIQAPQETGLSRGLDHEVFPWIVSGFRGSLIPRRKSCCHELRSWDSGRHHHAIAPRKLCHLSCQWQINLRYTLLLQILGFTLVIPHATSKECGVGTVLSLRHSHRTGHHFGRYVPPVMSLRWSRGQGIVCAALRWPVARIHDPATIFNRLRKELFHPYTSCLRLVAC